MIVIGLTGSIGMGKSTVAAQLAKLGVKVCGADRIVHDLLAKDGTAVAAVGAAFPGVVKDGAVDRKALGAVVFADRLKLKTLEQLLHPLVVAEENHFVARARLTGAKMAVLDIPLLFETHAQERCDMTVVVTAPQFIQRQRVLKRPGMTEAKFSAILQTQMPDSEKRHLADWVIDTGLGKARSFRDAALLVKTLRSV
jgi:dephospho-CoA kinase